MMCSVCVCAVNERVRAAPGVCGRCVPAPFIGIPSVVVVPGIRSARPSVRLDGEAVEHITFL